MKQRLKKRIAEDKAELRRLTDSPTLDEQCRETIAKIEAAEATAREKIQTIVEQVQSVTGRKLRWFGSYRNLGMLRENVRKRTIDTLKRAGLPSGTPYRAKCLIDDLQEEFNLNG